MAYARFGRESGVYVFLHVDGHFECHNCAMSEHHYRSTTTAEMVAHLYEHRAAGQVVQQSTIDELIEDADENDRWILTGEEPSDSVPVYLI